jgi:hypothetical protein
VAQTTIAEPAAAPKGLAARLAGVLTSPRATYADIAARPRWFGALAVVAVAGAAAIFIFLSTEVGKQAMLDQQVRTLESFGVKLTDVQYDRMEQGLRFAPYTGAAGQIVVLTLGALVVSGIALAIFNAVMGGDGTFKQVFAVVVHSGFALTISQLFGLPLAYARETLSSATNLGVFAPFLDESSFAARLLGSIDLFQIWWITTLAIGFGVLYRRRTGPIATTMFVVYGAIVLVIAAIRTALSGA